MRYVLAVCLTLLSANALSWELRERYLWGELTGGKSVLMKLRVHKYHSDLWKKPFETYAVRGEVFSLSDKFPLPSALKGIWYQDAGLLGLEVYRLQAHLGKGGDDENARHEKEQVGFIAGQADRLPFWFEGNDALQINGHWIATHRLSAAAFYQGAPYPVSSRHEVWLNEFASIALVDVDGDYTCKTNVGTASQTLSTTLRKGKLEALEWTITFIHRPAQSCRFSLADFDLQRRNWQLFLRPKSAQNAPAAAEACQLAVMVLGTHVRHTTSKPIGDPLLYLSAGEGCTCQADLLVNTVSHVCHDFWPKHK